MLQTIALPLRSGRSLVSECCLLFLLVFFLGVFLVCLVGWLVGWTKNTVALQVEVAHFGFPITMEILGKAGEPCHSPVLYMEVFGVDYWQRHISLGYGFVNIPQVPGCHKLRIPVWKPVPNIRARAREFFVGAGARLRDIKLSGVPPGFSDSVLNLYGHENQTCGSVETSFNVVIAKHAIQQQVDTADLIKATGLK